MVLDLARLLPAQGFDVRVVAAGGGGEMESDLLDADIPFAVNPQAGSRRAALAFLRGEIAGHRPAVWHSHLTPVWAGLAARSSRVRPWIATMHGFESKLPWPMRTARGMAYRAADHVVCVSEAVRRSVATIGADDVSVIPPGIDLSRFARREARLAADVPELLTVSRLVPEKGIDVLLEALSESLRPWRLTIVGDGPELPALRRRAEVLGILPRVRFVGAVADPAPFYRQADLFCFPSRSEGQGMALLEAAASRLPAVASDLPAIREAFGEDAVAYASSDNVESWRRAIERALSRYPEALTRAERASRIVTQRYSLTAMVEAHAKLYRGWIERVSV
jgi:glycosyltransferase involved in cell wall biosynthesis